MATTAALTENSRQGINFQIPPCIGSEAWLSPNPRRGCGHAYDETSVGFVVYVRNDPVNFIDPDGKKLIPFIISIYGHTNKYIYGDYQGTYFWRADYFMFIEEGSDSVGPAIAEPGGGPPALDKRNPNGIECQSDIIAAMSKAWMQSSNGKSGAEAGFTLQGASGRYTITPNAFTNESKKQTIVLPRGSFALFHVHPDKTDPRPLGADIEIADQYGLQMYTISARGLYHYDPDTKITVQLTDQLNFLDPCKKETPRDARESGTLHAGRWR